MARNGKSHGTNGSSTFNSQAVLDQAELLAGSANIIARRESRYREPAEQRDGDSGGN